MTRWQPYEAIDVDDGAEYPGETYIRCHSSQHDEEFEAFTPPDSRPIDDDTDQPINDGKRLVEWLEEHKYCHKKERR